MKIQDFKSVQHVIDSSPYRNVLKQYERDEITYLDLQYEVACGVLDHMDMLKFQKLPHPPGVFAEYDQKYANSTNPLAKRKVQERVCSLDVVQKFMEEHSALVAINSSNADWLETCIVTMLAKGDMRNADRLHSVYLTYPAELRGVNRHVSWFKKSGDWWNMMAENKRRIDQNEREKLRRSGPEPVVGPDQEQQPKVRQVQRAGSRV